MKRSAFFCLFCVSICCTARTQDLMPSRSATGDIGELLRFADHLFQRREYYRAITEYERYLFLSSPPNENAYARLQLALAYHHGGHPLDSRDQIHLLREDAPQSEEAIASPLLLAASYRKEENSGLAAMTLESFFLDHPARREGQLAGLLAGIEFLRADDPQTARHVLKESEKISDEGLKQEATQLLHDVESYADLPMKRPWLAGTLSTLLPGAGQLYTGNRGDALAAFLLNGILIYASYEAFDREQYTTGILLATLETGWYFGNIYNAVNGAHKVNHRQKQRFVERIDLRLAPIWMSDSNRLGIGALYTF